MSRIVITDIVMPIVSRILNETDPVRFPRYAIVKDEDLEQYLEEEMKRWFGVIGADGCQHLREKLEDARRNDPSEFDNLLKELLTTYVKLQIKIRQAMMRKLEDDGPPDRFLQMRRKYAETFERYET